MVGIPFRPIFYENQFALWPISCIFSDQNSCIMVNFQEWVYQQALIALAEQRADGSMPNGCNGPYSHEETPLRNTGHWLITWSYLGQRMDEPKLTKAAERALEYMLFPQHRPAGANWLQRRTPGRDSCNGTIGAAWTIEALCAAYRYLGSEEAINLATEVFDLHPFLEEIGLWKRLEVDGTVLSLDQTFNHQLWFASAASRLARVGHSEAKGKVERFFECLSRHFSVYRNGLIRHKIRLKAEDYIQDPNAVWGPAYRFYRKVRGRRVIPLIHLRDIGYHAFNLHAFAIIKLVFPDFSFWSSTSFLKAMEYVDSKEHKESVGIKNPYGMPYNPVGFEVAFTLGSFLPKSKEKQKMWIDRQIMELTHNKKNTYGESVIDFQTARARLCEMIDWFEGEKSFT